MTTPLRPRTAELKEIIEFALSVGAISYDGDSWYAASDEGGAGLGYERCEASFAAARQALNELVEAEAALDLRAALERLRDEATHLAAISDTPSSNFHVGREYAFSEVLRLLNDTALAAPAADGLDVLTLLRDLVNEVGSEPITDNKARRMGAWIKARNYLDTLREPSREPGEEG